MRFSVTTRIAVLAISLALISNLALVVFVWGQTRSEAIEAVRRETVVQADALTDVWRSGGEQALADAIVDEEAPGHAILVIAILDQAGRRLVGVAPDRLATRLAPTSFAIARLGTSGIWADRDAGYLLRRLGPHWLLVGRNLDLIAAEQRAIERALVLAVFLSLGLGILGGLVVTRYVAQRMTAIARVVEAAGEGDLSRRVDELPGGNDVFDVLAVRLNAMLGKVERLMAELRVVTDSLAHDLRSPLARLRTKTEQALVAADPAQRDAALGGLLAETDLVMRMLTMLIEISRSEAVLPDRFTLVAPAELVEEVAELYEPAAEEAGMSFTAAIDARPAPMLLHRELMSQAIANLLDNALKHAPSGGAMTLRLAQTARTVEIAVEDRGPGIAAEDRAQALKRFGRLDQARSAPGAGLGMALIEAVARLHGGAFELDDNGPGLAARIVLPR